MEKSCSLFMAKKREVIWHAESFVSVVFAVAGKHYGTDSESSLFYSILWSVGSLQSGLEM